VGPKIHSVDTWSTFPDRSLSFGGEKNPN
jgi:hypothetical protein